MLSRHAALVHREDLELQGLRETRVPPARLPRGCAAAGGDDDDDDDDVDDDDDDDYDCDEL